MLGNCSCFHFLCWLFSKSRFLQINHLGILSDCQAVGIQIKLDILLVFKLFAKAISRRQNSLLACLELLSVLAHLGSYKYSDTLKDLAIESFLLPNAKWDTFIPSLFVYG